MIQFLPAILLLGLITTYEDIRYGKIRNRWIISALVYSVVINTFLLRTAANLNTHYLIELFTNFAFAIAIGYGLWHIGIWTAGDGKLFIAYAALVPLSIYNLGYLEWIPSAVLMMNVFVPATVLFTIIILRKSKPKVLFETFKQILKQIFEPKTFLLSFIQFFAIIWATRSLLTLLGLEFLSFFASFGVLYLISKYLNRYSNYLIIGTGILRLLFDKDLFSFSALFEIILFVLIWKSIRTIYKRGMMKLGYDIFSSDVAVKELRPGMILSDCITRKDDIGKEHQDKLNATNIENKVYRGKHYIKVPMGGRSFFEEEPEGLTKHQIRKIKQIGFKKVRVSSTLPFAPFMFAGVLLTLLAKGNILIIITNLLI